MTDQHPHATDSDLKRALVPDSTELVDLETLGAVSGVSTTVLSMLIREGWITEHTTGAGTRFDPSEMGAVTAGMRLIETGLPMAELLDLARRMDAAMDPLASLAVDVFARFVRDSVEAGSGSTDEAVERLTTAIDGMLPVTSELVGQHFRRLVIKHATRRLDQ